MPSLREHMRMSQLRTGKTYEKLHKWMDIAQKELGIKHREINHSTNDIEKVKKYWKKNPQEAVQEFLIHIIADYQDTTEKLLKNNKYLNKY